jgi:hypothetical protein
MSQAQPGPYRNYPPQPTRSISKELEAVIIIGILVVVAVVGSLPVMSCSYSVVGARSGPVNVGGHVYWISQGESYTVVGHWSLWEGIFGGICRPEDIYRNP